ncbi:MAG: hypothetical protein WC728_11370 [Elusimicrobiota bacterium]
MTLSVPLALALAVPAHAGLYAAAGKADITPDLRRSPVWLAGFGAKGRRAEGVLDRLYARALVVSDGKRTVAFVGVDSLGLFREDVLDIRRRLGLDVFVAATHTHSAPDSLGLWGRWPGVSGVSPQYQERVKKAVIGLVKELSGRMQEARMLSARKDLDLKGLCRDSRDPVVLDPELDVLSFRGKNGAMLGTLVRWSCHAEVLGRENKKVSADYPGALCERVERRTGGECLFFPGLIGGLMTPDVHEEAGVRQEAAMRWLGSAVADAALSALDKAESWDEAEVSMSSAAVRVPVENSRYLIFLHSLRRGHTLYDAEGWTLSRWEGMKRSARALFRYPLPKRLRPWIETEVSLVRLGPVAVLGVPGEMFPETAPGLRERLGAHGIIAGLANDEIGYLVPAYDFKVTPNRFMHPRPPGTHYEETNSVGKETTGRLLQAYDRLLY